MDPGVPGQIGHGRQEPLGQPHQIGVQFHVSELRHGAGLENLRPQAGHAAPQQEHPPGLGVFQQAQLDLVLGGQGIGIGEQPEVIGKKTDLLRFPAGRQQGIRAVHGSDHLPSGPLPGAAERLQAGGEQEGRSQHEEIQGDRGPGHPGPGPGQEPGGQGQAKAHGQPQAQVGIAAHQKKLQQRHPQGGAQALQIIGPPHGPLGSRGRQNLDRVGEKVAGHQPGGGQEEQKEQEGGGQRQGLAQGQARQAGEGPARQDGGRQQQPQERQQPAQTAGPAPGAPGGSRRPPARLPTPTHRSQPHNPNASFNSCPWARTSSSRRISTWEIMAPAPKTRTRPCSLHRPKITKNDMLSTCFIFATANSPFDEQRTHAPVFGMAEVCIGHSWKVQSWALLHSLIQYYTASAFPGGSCGRCPGPGRFRSCGRRSAARSG